MQLLIERLLIVFIIAAAVTLGTSFAELPTQAETARNIASFIESQNHVEVTQPYLISNR